MIHYQKLQIHPEIEKTDFLTRFLYIKNEFLSVKYICFTRFSCIKNVIYLSRFFVKKTCPQKRVFKQKNCYLFFI